MAESSNPLALLAMVGAGESEIPVLAELHRNPGVHIVGVYDPDPEAIGHEMAEILGLRHDSSRDFLRQIAAAHHVILPDDRDRLSEEIDYLKDQGTRLLGPDEALLLFGASSTSTPEPRLRPRSSGRDDSALHELEDAVRWLDRAMHREEILRGLLSIVIQAVGADNGSIQLLNAATDELYIAYADGLSDHTIRSCHQKLGEGIAGRVAARREAELIQGPPEQPERRDRPDISSAACVPLVANGRVLGVINVSIDAGLEPLGPEDLSTVERMAQRISAVLSRLLEIQAYHERALLDDLERGLDRLVQMDVELPMCLGLVRDLLQDLAGAVRSTLIILTPDGLAYRVKPNDTGRSGAESARDVDPTAGILGQVLLTREIVLMEERTRAAGDHRTRRFSKLYVPLGEPEPFAVFIPEFEGLSALAHFKRALDGVRQVVTPHLGAILLREERRGRLDRLGRLASGLSHLATVPAERRARACATLLGELSEASAVAVWQDDGPHPTTVLGGESFGRHATPQLWQMLRERMQTGESSRIREVDPEGSSLRSLLLVGTGTGPAIAAFNRTASAPLDEEGFRDEDLDAAALILATLESIGEPVDPELREPPSQIPPAPARLRPSLTDHQTNRRLLLDAVEREIIRAQRYHFGFSLTCFQVNMPADQLEDYEPRIQFLISTASRATDCILWTGPLRFAVLAPEEARGQRRLSRRFQSLMKDFLEREADGMITEVRVQHASYPHDADEAHDLLEAAEHDLAPN